MWGRVRRILERMYECVCVCVCDSWWNCEEEVCVMCGGEFVECWRGCMCVCVCVIVGGIVKRMCV